WTNRAGGCDPSEPGRKIFRPGSDGSQPPALLVQPDVSFPATVAANGMTLGFPFAFGDDMRLNRGLTPFVFWQ
ncbi:MAG: hypothetical protein WCD88_15040, partial [Desulfobacterales bacterium]